HAARTQRAQDQDALDLGRIARRGRAGLVDEQGRIGAAEIEIEKQTARIGGQPQRFPEVSRAYELELTAEKAPEALAVFGAILANEELHAGGAGKQAPTAFFHGGS